MKYKVLIAILAITLMAIEVGCGSEDNQNNNIPPSTDGDFADAEELGEAEEGYQQELEQETTPETDLEAQEEVQEQEEMEEFEQSEVEEEVVLSDGDAEQESEAAVEVEEASEVEYEAEPEEVEPPECLDGIMRCNGNTVQICTNGSWTNEMDCATGEHCTESDGVALCSSACDMAPCEYNGDPNRTVCVPTDEEPFYRCDCTEGTTLVSGGNVEPTELCLPEEQACPDDKTEDLGTFDGTQNLTATGNTCNDIPFIIQGLGENRCTGTENPGPEHVYSVQIAPNTPALVKLTPTTETYDPSLYIIDNCSNIAACTLGVDEFTAGTAETLLIPESENTQQLLIVVDSAFAEDSGPANDSWCGEYQIEISLPQECFITEITGLPFGANVGTRADSQVEAHIGNNVYSGPDAMFRIQMESAKSYQISIEPQGDLDLYILPDFNCYLGAPTPNVLAYSINEGTETDEIIFSPPENGYYIIVVDSLENAPSANFLLMVRELTRTTTCDGIAGTITDLPAQIQGTTVSEDDTYFLSGCGWLEYHGRDAVYALNATEGTTYQVSVNPLSANHDIAVYILDSCNPQVQGQPAPQCIGLGDDGEEGEPESVQFTSPITGTLFIVVDGWTLQGEDPGGTFFLNVEQVE